MKYNKSRKSSIIRRTKIIGLFSLIISMSIGILVNQTMASEKNNLMTSNRPLENNQKVLVAGAHEDYYHTNWDDDEWYTAFYNSDINTQEDKSSPHLDEGDNWIVTFYKDHTNIPGYRPNSQDDVFETNTQEITPHETDPKDISSPEVDSQEETSEKSSHSATLQPVDETQDMPHKINSSAVVEHFHELVNQERIEHGLNELHYGDHLQTAAKNRTIEITEHFSHTRPNGDPFNTADGFEQGGTIVGENLQQSYIPTDVKAKEIAEILFTNWKNSPNHYQNIIDSSYTVHAIEIDTYPGEDNIIIYATHVFSN